MSAFIDNLIEELADALAEEDANQPSTNYTVLAQFAIQFINEYDKAAIDKVRLLHRPAWNTAQDLRVLCNSCHDTYPCSTIKALEETS